MTNRQNNNKD